MSKQSVLLYLVFMISLISTTAVSPLIHLPPLRISGPSDLSYLVGTTGNKLIWVYRAHESDDTPSTYTVTQDGVILSKHNAASWQDDVDIVVDIDGLNVDNYIFKITVKDNGVDQGKAAPATDSVTVTVFSISTSTTTSTTLITSTTTTTTPTTSTTSTTSPTTSSTSSTNPATTTTSSSTNTQSTATSSNPDTFTTSDPTMISNSVTTPIDTDTLISSETSSINSPSEPSSSLIPSSVSSTVTSLTSENPQVPIRFLMSFLFVFALLTRIRKLR